MMRSPFGHPRLVLTALGLVASALASRPAEAAAPPRAYDGVESIDGPASGPADPPAPDEPASPPDGRALPGADVATRGDASARLGTGLPPHPRRAGEAEPHDAVAGPPTGPSMPGAEVATRDDVSASLANRALDEDGREVFHPWEVGGFLDTSYAFNNNFPDNHVWRGSSVQPRTGEFTLNLAVVYLRRDPVPGRVSPMAELALQFGPGADVMYIAEPMPGDDASHEAGVEVWKHLARANIGFKVRRGTEIQAGIHLAPIGIGLHWTPFQWTYSSSWEINGVPFYLAGLKIVHPIGERHALQAWVVNGWNTAVDINKAPSTMFAYTYSPSPRLAFAEYAWFGPENADIRLRAWRMFSDTQLTYNVDKFGFSAVYDAGGERRTDLPGEPWNMWMSAALFTRWRVLGERRTWDMVLRPEWFWDRDGRIYGIPQTLAGITYTNDVRAFAGVLLRLEYRYDHSTNPNGFFYRGSAITDDAIGLAQDQHMIFFAVAGVFAHRFGRPTPQPR
ncbi:MAG: outer membrane beta-barrel protein [Myxococcales bacterium]|nr:outer membrane beta-barrel protein [Myxococcales bacterium]